MFSKTMALRFPAEQVGEPIVVKLVKDYDLSLNILKAKVFPGEEGLMVLELTGTKKNYQDGVRYLKELGIKVESMGQEIKRDEVACFQCGACTAVCPSEALYIKRPEMEVLFDKEKCIGCEMCVPACPAQAMAVSFDKRLLK